MKSLLRLLLKLCFGFKTYNQTSLRADGPILLVPNHVSWFDWLFLALSVEDDWKFVTSSTAAQRSWLHRLIMINRRTLPVDTDSPYAVKHMAEHLKGGGRLILFAEGRLSKTGSLMRIFDGTGFLLLKTNARVITCYLRGANRLFNSPNPNRKKWFPRVSAHFSEPLVPPKVGNLPASQQPLSAPRDQVCPRNPQARHPKNQPPGTCEDPSRTPKRFSAKCLFPSGPFCRVHCVILSGSRVH